MFKREAKIMLMFLMIPILLGIIGYAVISIVGRVQTCGRLKPGITKDVLVEKYGKPIGSSDDWVLFKSNPVAAGPIRAKIDTKTNKVTALKCTEDGSVNWKMSSIE